MLFDESGKCITEKLEVVNEGSSGPKQITSPMQNLESKIASLIRSIENLSSKKIRLEFEIRRQKKSLARKRMELKTISKSSQAKIKLSLESDQSQVLTESQTSEDRKRTQRLLQESARILESD